MRVQPIGSRQELIIVVVESDRHPQWSAAWSVLEPYGTLFSVPTIKAAEKFVHTGLFPDLIVFFQDHVFQFSEHDWRSFLARSPLTRAVLIFNDWCESEPRTSTQLPGVIRVHWLNWLNRGRELISELRQHRGTLLGLPSTASDEERLLAQMGKRFLEDKHPRFAHIAVITPSRESFTWIHQVALPFAQYISWVHETDDGHSHHDSSPDLLIIDTWTDLTAVQDTIDALRAGTWPNLSPFVPCIVLANFPRWEEVQYALRRGNTKLLAKPFLLSDFESALLELARNRGEEPRNTRRQCER